MGAKPSVRSLRGLADRLPECLTGAALIVGIAARCDQYWRQPPLWVDEQMLALTIGTRGFTQLAGSLEFGQMAPVGFSSIEWVALEFFGSGERALRLVPMLSGITMLILLTMLARHTLSRAAAAVVVIGAALSPPLLLSANEVKPYSSDTAVGLAIILLAFWIIEHPSPLRQWVYWGVVTAVGAILSFPSVLVTCATGLALLPIALQHRRLPVLLGLGGVAAMIAVVTAAVGRSPDLTAFMSTFWASQFLAVSHPLESLAMLGIAPGSVVAVNIERPTLPAIAFALAAWAGAAVLARKNPRSALVLFGSVALAVGLAVTRTYPISSRTWLFAAPLFLIGFGGSVDWLARQIPKPGWRAPAILTAAAVVLGLGSASRIRDHGGIVRQNPKAPLAYLKAHRQDPAEPIYVFARAAPAWLWYQTDWNSQVGRDRTRQLVAVRSPGQELFHNGPWTAELSAKSLALSQWTTERGMELFGRPSGLKVTFRERGDVEPHWAVAERRRIEALTARCIWLFASNVYPAEWRALTTELDQAGWAAGPESGGRDSRTSRYCRPATGPT